MFRELNKSILLFILKAIKAKVCKRGKGNFKFWMFNVELQFPNSTFNIEHSKLNL